MVNRNGSDKVISQQFVEGKKSRFGLWTDPNISIASINELLDLPREHVANFNLDGRILLGKASNDLRDNARHHGRNAGDDDTAAVNGCEVTKVLTCHFQFLERPAGASSERLPFYRQRHTASCSMDQSNAEMCLKIADVRAHSRLRKLQALGCTAKASRFSKADQGQDMAHGQVEH